MTEIAHRQPAEVAMASDAADVDSWVAVVQEISKLASVICDTDFVPKAYRGNAPAAAAAMLTGRELGLPPMTSLRHVQVVEGSPSLSAEYKRARVQSAGHEFDVLEISTTKCTVSGRRRGSKKPPTVITYTIEDARTARLVRDRGPWQTRPRRMLFARAGTELCDFLFADVTNGLPTTELLEQDGDGVSGYDEQPARPSGRVTAAEITARPSAPQNASPAVRQVAPVPADPSTPPAEPAGEAPDSGPAPSGQPAGNEPAAGPGGSERHGKLAGVVRQQFRRLGFTDAERDQRLAATAALAGIGGTVSSTKHLDEDELTVVADGLARCKDRDALIALMVAGEVTGDE